MLYWEWLHTLKKRELVLRKQIESKEWEEVFANTTQEHFDFDQSKEIAQSIKQHYEEFLEMKVEDCLISKNFGKWAKAMQGFWFQKCGEDVSTAKVRMGEIPSVIVKPAVKPKQGDVRAMVLPGGGTLQRECGPA